MDQQQKKRLKKRATAATMAAAASAGVIMGGLFDDPSDLLNGQDDAPLAVTDLAVSPDAGDGDGPDAGDAVSDEEEEEERRTFRSRARARILGWPIGVRAVVGVPLWCVGWLLITIFSGVWSAVLTPAAGAILRFVLLAACMIGAFAVIAKAIAPDIPLQKILNRKTVPAMIITAALLAAADVVVPLFWDGWDKIAAAVRILGTGGVLAALVILFARKAERRRKKKEAAAKITAGPKAVIHETQEHAMARVRALADTVSRHDRD